MDRRRFLGMLPAAAALSAFRARADPLGLPRAAPVPGGVAILKLGPQAEPPLVRFNGERALVVGDASEWLTVVGIPLDAAPGGTLPLVVERIGREAETLAIGVRSKRYATQRLKVKPGQVELSPEDLARYEQERAHLAEVLKTFSDSGPASLRLLPPVRRAPARARSGCGAFSTASRAILTTGWISLRPPALRSWPRAPAR